MIDFTLALAVVISVVLVGLLISIGNERHRNELRLLREQVENWALEDLLIKRSKVLQQVSVPDPLIWLSKISGTALEKPINLEHVELLQNPLALVGYEGNRRLFFSLVSPSGLPKSSIFHRKTKRLAGAIAHPLAESGRKLKALEISALNGGYTFDIELAEVWKQLAGETTTARRLWVYQFTEQVHVR